MTSKETPAYEDLSPYQVQSPREIVALLRKLNESNQLIRMVTSSGAEPIVTSILAVDDTSDMVVLDCGANETVNRQIASSENISFETALEHIRILFFSQKIDECLYDDLPAFSMSIPTNMIRLQRREYYRVITPIANPVKCKIQIPQSTDGMESVVSVVLQNVSGGGVAIVDDKRLLDATVGRIYRDCRIDLPGGTLVIATLQIRNVQEVRGPNGRTMIRLGCLFVELPKPMLSAVQRYITKLEREHYARTTGMG